MEQFNQQLFLALNAPFPDGNHWQVQLAVFLANWLIWLLPLILAGGWLCGEVRQKRAMLGAALTALLALAGAAIVGRFWPHPRPFMLGLGHLLIAHGADASLPSDHLTMWWGITLGLAGFPRFRRFGLLLACIGLTVAWARIYVGVHFPLDMLAALLVAVCSAGLMQAFLQPAIKRATLAAMHIQRWVALPLILIMKEPK